ncbi:MAG: S8 family serine peptidase [Solirubrobacteraceae bacterium]|nr:S8 family serine peptidase [Solirubrobacteraceae bacterium]
MAFSSVGVRALLLATALAAPFAAQAQAAPATGADRELDSTLQDLVGADIAGDPVAALAEERQVTVTPGERVLVDVYVSGDLADTARRIAAAGMDVRGRIDGPPVRLVSGYLPVDGLRAITRVAGVTAVLPTLQGGTDAGAALSEGDAAHRGPEARALGVDGAGVKVGVISDSVNLVDPKVAGSQASGDLPPAPAGMEVLTDASSGVDEGRAMAEIVYDTAPGITEMAFASGTAGQAAGKIAAIGNLVAAGAKVIADDIFYLDQPFFQDGPIAQAVDRARDAGVAYFASAGNRARQSWEDAPRFDPATGFQNFKATGAPDTTQTLLTIPSGGAITVVLQWDEPWTKAKHDIDIQLVNPTTNAVLLEQTTDNIGTGIPREVLGAVASGGPASVGIRIRRKAQAPGAPELTRLKYIVRTDFGSFSIGEYGGADTINPDAASARGAMAVAAISQADVGLNDPQTYSSRGPKTRLFDAAGTRLAVPEVRQKPDLAAADNVATTIPRFNPFRGTSAAAPSAAGVAALALSAKPTLPLPVLRAILTSPVNTIDCSLPGLPDTDCGSGFVLADRVVAQAQDPSPPVVTQTVAPAAPTGANGWWTGDVSVSYAVTEPGSPALLAGCEAETRSIDGSSTTPACVAQSAGGTTTRAGVTLRRDTRPPDTPQITGIGGAYPAGQVPTAVGCVSSDATSGLASCTVTPVQTAVGAHTLTATATDNAGLTSTSTVAYEVVAVPVVVPVPAGGVAGISAGSFRAASVVTLPSATRCVPATTRLKVRVRAPRGGAIRAVTVTMTGVKSARTLKKAGTITLARLQRKRATVTVTVTLRDGRKSTITRTYRRC